MKKNKKEEEKNLTEFSIDELVVSVFNQVAEWHNNDSTSPGLKQLSFDLINEVVGATFNHLNIPYNGEVKIDGEAKKEAIKKKEELKNK